MPEWWRSHAPGSCAFMVHGVPFRRVCALERASITRPRIDAESRVCVDARSARLGVCTSMRMSIRSSNGPDKRARYLRRFIEEQVHRRPPYPPPQGQGLDAITSWNAAGYRA